MSNINYVSKEGLESLKTEVQQLKTVERRKISQMIKEAREQGDLSENAEYDAAKEAQGMLELKINKLETLLGNSRIIDESIIDRSQVTVLSSVKLKNLKNGTELRFKLVSEKEADVKAKKLSVTSPIGRGLLGKKIGDIAKIQVPSGMMEFEILDIGI